mmetsp:Transcript_71537/g.134871  ORF Transcript_71537/g.134871 Transcript_71537/m.134871 type:complete len:271 (-) Transcript_71537:665-1477(-)
MRSVWHVVSGGCFSHSASRLAPAHTDAEPAQAFVNPRGGKLRRRSCFTSESEERKPCFSNREEKAQAQRARCAAKGVAEGKDDDGGGCEAGDPPCAADDAAVSAAAPASCRPLSAPRLLTAALLLLVLDSPRPPPPRPPPPRTTASIILLVAATKRRLARVAPAIARPRYSGLPLVVSDPLLTAFNPFTTRAHPPLPLTRFSSSVADEDDECESVLPGAVGLKEEEDGSAAHTEWQGGRGPPSAHRCSCCCSPSSCVVATEEDGDNDDEG